MKKNICIVFLSIMFLACRSKSNVVSPYKDKILVFEWNESLIPSKKTYIKIYPSSSKDNYYSIRSIMDLPIHIYWGDTIKIRGGLFVDSNIIKTGIIDWKNDYTEFDQLQISLNDTNWRHYFISEIGEGKYE